MLYLSKRPKINVHEHIQAGFDFKKYIEVMETFNIEKVFLLATGTQKGNKGYEPHQEYLAKVKAKYPKKIEMFITIDHLKKSCIKDFEKGLKYKPLGLKLMNGHPAFTETSLLSANLIPLFKRCQKEGMIVLIHWQLNIKKENWDILDETLGKFPRVFFQLAHLGVAQANFSKLAGLLNKHNNLYLDCSWGGYFGRFVKEVDWESEKFNNFYSEYANRIAWGTDQVMSSHTAKQLLWQHATEIAILEKNVYQGWQKYFPARDVFGLGLDEDTLDQIFYKTPQAILNRDFLKKK